MTNLWWQKRWQNNNDGDNGSAVLSLSSWSSIHCHLFTFIVNDISSSSYHHLIIVMEILSSPSCHWQHRHLVIVSLLKSYHHNHVIIVILSSYLVFVILSLSSCRCHLLLLHCLLFFPVSSSFLFFTISIHRSLSAEIRLSWSRFFLSPPSSPSNTFGTNSSLRLSQIAEIHRLIDSLLSGSALNSYLRKFSPQPDWLPGLAAERAALAPELFNSSGFESDRGFYSSARRKKFVFISFRFFQD